MLDELTLYFETFSSFRKYIFENGNKLYKILFKKVELLNICLIRLLNSKADSIEIL